MVTPLKYLIPELTLRCLNVSPLKHVDGDQPEGSIYPIAGISPGMMEQEGKKTSLTLAQGCHFDAKQNLC